MRRSNAARGARGGQQELAANVGAFRHLERELVVRCGDYRTAATADGAAGAVRVADVLEGESGAESEGCGVTSQYSLHCGMCFLFRGYRRGGREAMKKRRNAALDADRLSAYEACRRVEGRSVNRLLCRFCAWRALTRRVRGYFVRLQLGVQPEAERDGPLGRLNTPTLASLGWGTRVGAQIRSG
jgi:hypothetical protein